MYNIDYALSDGLTRLYDDWKGDIPPALKDLYEAARSQERGASDALYLLCLLYDAVEDEKLGRQMSKRTIVVDGAMSKVKAFFDRTGVRSVRSKQW